MSALQALIFDVDGTLADTEELHRAAFNQAFEEAGLDWHWDRERYTQLLDTSGGPERIARHRHEVQATLTAMTVQPLMQWIQALHQRKTELFGQWLRDGALCLRPGVAELIESSRGAGIRLAIATTTSPSNVKALLQANLGAKGERCFEVIEDAQTAPIKKPHPQAYLQAMRRLNLPARACLALEDSANGLQSARAAGLAVLVTPTAYTAHHPFDGALQVRPHLGQVQVADLRTWHAQAHAVHD